MRNDGALSNTVKAQRFPQEHRCTICRLVTKRPDLGVFSLLGLVLTDDEFTRNQRKRGPWIGKPKLGRLTDTVDYLEVVVCGDSKESDWIKDAMGEGLQLLVL